MKKALELFIFILFLIPIYGLLIWAYLDPENSLLFGNRWMYKERPEFTEEAIKFQKRRSLIAIFVITFIVVLIIIGSY